MNPDDLMFKTWLFEQAAFLPDDVCSTVTCIKAFALPNKKQALALLLLLSFLFPF